MSEVNRIREELLSLREIIHKTDSMSDFNAFEAFAAKTLLMAAASYFEKRICDDVSRIAETSGTNAIFVNFIEKQALSRKFHTMFNWDAGNINSFLVLFGDDFKKMCSAEIKDNQIRLQSIRDFIFINSHRNLLVHNNFSNFNLNVSFEDIWKKFESAIKILDWLAEKLNNTLERV